MMGNVAGKHRSPHRGSSVEFAEYRKYVPGDDTRRLDWKAFARSDRFYIKEFEADTNLRLCLLMDTSGSMNFGPAGATRFDYARRLGGTMAYLAAARTDTDAAVGYYGTRIDSYLDDGPKISRPLILHLGRLDHRTPPPIMSAILAAVAGNTKVEPFIYENAHHGFANHTRPDVYDPEATQAANERSVAFFRKHLS